MAEPVLYGPAFSTYVRSARLALVEKGVSYRLEEVNIFGDPKAKAAYLARQPFGKVPAFEHDGFKLYETEAIMRYVDEAFPGSSLQPSTPRERARMTQIFNITNNYLYPTAITQIVLPRFVAATTGAATDEAAIESAIPAARRCFEVIDALQGTNAHLAGGSLSLADLHLVPIYAYFSQQPEAQHALSHTPNLSRWWKSIAARPSVAKTAPVLSAKT